MIAANPITLEFIAAALFSVAVLHTFSTRYFEHLAHSNPTHSGLWHLLGEVETVFGIWALVLLVSMALLLGWGATTEYLDSQRFVEPMFVFAIMVIAAGRPIMQIASDTVQRVAAALPLQQGL
ncbi:MAG: putative Na+/H+ antiporter, partial [Betaproteobacteria bacterium]